MLQRAQDIFKQLHQRVRTTLQVVADLAETVGVPPTMTAFLQRKDEQPWSPPPSVHGAQKVGIGGDVAPSSPASNVDHRATAAAATTQQQPASEADAPSNGGGSNGGHAPYPAGKSETQAATATKRRSKKRVLDGDRTLSQEVRALRVDDAINGSTYLARIIWSLGVAQLEKLGPLRPADIARMVMARSPVSLEPPNVARYIRRSKPTSICIDHTEGSSNFYRLNDQGKSLFEQKFGPSVN